MSGAVAVLGERPGGPAPPPLFWVKKAEMTEGKKTSKASNKKNGQGCSIRCSSVVN